MVLRGVAGSTRARVLVLVAALLATLAVGWVTGRAGAGEARCDRFASDSVARAAEVTGDGDDVLVIGDSYSAGLGLDRPVDSWPSRLPGTVHVAGFSGSGFSRSASPCGGEVSFAVRAPDAVRRSGAGLVVVEGGLNDWDQSAAAITAGFERLMGELAGHDVVVVGPVAAPSRIGRVPAVDALLARLAAAHGASYVSTLGLDLPYLDDRLHLTPAGHEAFGDYVAEQLAAR
jgi:acyl-CoA thioesterase-1